MHTFIVERMEALETNVRKVEEMVKTETATALLNDYV